MTFAPEQVEKVEQQIADSSILMCQNEIPHESNLTAFRLAKKHGGLFSKVNI
jgi:hypothetical protein